MTAILGPGSMVGELSMIDGPPRSASVTALLWRAPQMPAGAIFATAPITAGPDLALSELDQVEGPHEHAFVSIPSPDQLKISDPIITAGDEPSTARSNIAYQVLGEGPPDLGRPWMTAILGPGSMVGELSMIDGPPRSASVTALLWRAPQMPAGAIFATAPITAGPDLALSAPVRANRRRNGGNLVNGGGLITIGPDFVDVVSPSPNHPHPQGREAAAGMAPWGCD